MQTYLRCSARLAAKRRGKPNTEFIRHRPTVLDALPEVLISHFIFPHLDYESRINLNQCLPIWDRVSKKMPKNSIMKHDVGLRVKTLAKILDKLHHIQQYDYSVDEVSLLKGDPKLLMTSKLFKTLQIPFYFNILCIYPNFRDVTVNKALKFKDQTEYPEALYSKALVNNFISEIQNLKNKIDKENHLFTNEAPCLELIDSLRFV